ncbi:hypothetical protein G6F59_015810 [Rhizopus arrhizus]|nr:hypothetical protein G6F59_015810 [Rhizopus arrhizus]
MMPTTGPKHSSFMIRMRWFTRVSNAGATFWAPAAAASAMTSRISAAARARTTGPNGDGAFDELVVQRPCDVDALDAAAGLARIEEGAVDQGVDRVVQLGVGSHIGRIAAAQLQAYTDKAPRRAFLDDAPAAHRSGK